MTRGVLSSAATSTVAHAGEDEGGNTRNLRQRAHRPHVREASVGSLDRVFDTGKDPAHTGSGEQKAPYDGGPTFDAYGSSELRDSFFDAVFLPPEDVEVDDLLRHAEQTLPRAFRKKDPLSIKHFIPRQWHEVQSVVRKVATTRAGIKLTKSFLAFFVSYILCLVPSIRQYFGRYSYILPISSIINHSGRSLGGQVDGLIWTILGTATGLGWGSFGLWLSTVSAPAQTGYGAILAMFFCLYIFLIACMRSYFIRTYQFVISAGIAITYTCLAEVASNEISWPKLRAYGLAWICGQGVALIPCLLIAPDAGARPLAVALHNAFEVMVVRTCPLTDLVAGA
jgi:hypothetical protein